MIFQVGDNYFEKFTVTTETYNGFIQIFKDTNPLHISSEFSQSKGFKDKVMFGNILNGFISYFIGERLPLKNVIIHSQTIEYKSPVYLNENLSLHASVSNIYEAVNAVEFRYYFENSELKKVAKGKFQIGILL
jgi:3-hydroxybutyryl-CoA dehydratase